MEVRRKKCLMQVLRFITSTQAEEDKQLVVAALKHQVGIQKVNFDRVDGRDILEVEVKNTCPLDIERLLVPEGFICVQVQ